jgi:hypothetical protein
MVASLIHYALPGPCPFLRLNVVAQDPGGSASLLRFLPLRKSLDLPAAVVWSHGIIQRPI